MQVGYAQNSPRNTDVAPGFHISHAICEVWNEDEMRWIRKQLDTTVAACAVRDSKRFAYDRLLCSVVIYVIFQIQLIQSELRYVQSSQLLFPHLENSEE